MNQSPNRATWGFLAIAIGAILFGSIGVATKGLFAISDTNAISITLWRALIALPVLFLIGLFLLRRKMFAIPWRDLRLMIVAGFLAAVYQLAFVVAVQFSNVTIATLVTLCSVPLLVAFLASFLLKEQLHRNLYLAMGCAIVGVILLVGFQSGGSLGINVGFGIAMALLTAVANALFQISSRALANRYHPLQTLTVCFFVAVLFFLPLALVNGFTVSYPPVGWLLLLQLGIVVSVVAYFLLLFGLRTTPATPATIIGFLEPFTATILAILIFNEQLSSTGIFGALLLLGAMVIVWRTTTVAPLPVAE